MLKRFFLITFLIFISLFASSCQSKNGLNVDVLNQNIASFDNTPPDKIELINIINLGEFIVSQTHLNLGIIIVQNNEDEVGVYSTSKDDLIIPLLKNTSFTIRNDAVFKGYINAINSTDDSLTVYDLNGNIVIPKNKYNIATITGKVEIILDENGNMVEKKYFETILTLTESQFANGIVEPIIRYTEIDSLTGTRVETTSFEHEYKLGDVYQEVEYYELDISLFGLKDHYLKSIGNIIYVFDKTSSLVATHVIPTGVDMNSIVMFDGQILYQMMTIVPEFTNEYDFIANKNKYVLRTVSVDLLTGKETVIDFNYVILSSDFFMDKVGEAKYARITAHPIQSKIRMSSITNDFVINKKGTIVFDLDGLVFSNMRRLNDNFVYNTSTRLVFDNELNITFEVKSGSTFIYSENLISFSHNGKIGATDYKGVVQIPFIYNSLSNNFYEGATYGRNHLNEWIGVDVSGNTIDLKENVHFVTPGLILTYDSTPDLETGLYVVLLTDYLNSLQHRFELKNTTFNITMNQNPFMNEIIVRLQGEDGPIFVSIQKSK